VTIQVLILRVLQREGGYVDHPSDRGGATNMGITREALSEYRGYEVTKQEVKDLTEKEARQVYEQRYWIGPGLDGIGHRSLHLVDAVFDAAVNHGPSRAIKFIQAAVHATEDGILGPKTLEAVDQYTDKDLMARITAQRAKFYGRIITNRPSQAVFAHGWMNRLAEFIKIIPKL